MQDFAQLMNQMQRTAQTLTPETLSGLDSSEEMLGDLHLQSDRFLGFYTMDGLRAALSAYKIDSLLRVLGYASWDLQWSLEETQHRLQLRADGQVFAELRARLVDGIEDENARSFQRNFMPKLLHIDYFSLNHWRHPLDKSRLLPGQISAPTGQSRVFLVLTWLMARRLRLHGLEQTPLYFHNAVIYREKNRFVDPLFEGQFEACLDLLPELGLHRLSWAIERGQLIDAQTGHFLKWTPHSQLYALSQELKAYFLTPHWRNARQKAKSRCHPQLANSPSHDWSAR